MSALRADLVGQIRELADRLSDLGDEEAELAVAVMVQLEDEPWDPTVEVTRKVINRYHEIATSNRTVEWNTYQCIADEPGEAWYEVLDTADALGIATGPIHDELHDAFDRYVERLEALLDHEKES